MKRNKILPSRNSDCYKCNNLLKDEKGEFICIAFPEQIPIEILSGKIKHREPIQGQNGSFVFWMKDEFFYPRDECVIVTE